MIWPILQSMYNKEKNDVTLWHMQMRSGALRIRIRKGETGAEYLRG